MGWAINAQIWDAVRGFYTNGLFGGRGWRGGETEQWKGLGRRNVWGCVHNATKREQSKFAKPLGKIRVHENVYKSAKRRIVVDSVGAGD